ncbi:hypothetical protein PVL29_018210 [Vitis rotundifolia]|uniref:Uncharacterized protein n=1 Tax=Vitis rotundifolia TaxID=103349 RepID=A0AA38Z4P5_VITRO|nr:hypothetical protein PVL29_018210 [Vitis rotundifolia]
MPNQLPLLISHPCARECIHIYPPYSPRSAYPISSCTPPTLVPHLTRLLGAMSKPSTAMCIRKLTTVLLRECVLHNKFNGNGKMESIEVRVMKLAETHAFYVLNTGEAFARIIMSNGIRTVVLRGRSYLVKGYWLFHCKPNRRQDCHHEDRGVLLSESEE